MTSLSALLLGLGLGLRHATDADHVAVVSTLLAREPSPRRAVRIAAWWGAGHTLSFLGLGVLVLGLGIQVPERFEHVAAALVGAMLLGFGAAHLARALFRARLDAGGKVSLGRPAAAGVVHGLAGSAAVALVASTTIPSRALAFAYLALFAAGTVLGMVVLTLALSWPIAWGNRRSEDRVGRLASLLASSISVLLGALVLADLARGTL